jgi:transposase-like protein
VIVVAVRWYLRHGLSYRDLEELLAERGVEVDHVSVYRWVQRFTPLLGDAARLARHSPGDRWFVDETYVKVNGVWRYVYRAVDQYGQVIDVLPFPRRDATAARRFFTRATRTLKVTPSEVVTDAAPVSPAVLDEVLPSAWHHVEQYANNPIEADSQLKRPAATDARTPDRSDSTGRDRRARLPAEPPPRPLQPRTRHSAGHPTRRSVHRTRPSDLISRGLMASARPSNRQRNGAWENPRWGYVRIVGECRKRSTRAATRVTRPANQRALQAATVVTLLGLGIAVAVGT